MPIPIRPRQDSNEDNSFVDYSFLTRQLPNIDRKRVTASNNDASALMKIWTDASNDGDQFVISADLGLSQRDITRLKTYGLLAGSSDKVSFTERGKKILTVMTLGEVNKFEKGKVEKSYLEIMASMDLRGKSGYRIPKFASSSSNTLRLDQN